MDSGQMKHSITFYRPSASTSIYSTTHGIVYVEYCKVYAEKINVGGNRSIQNYELFNSQQIQFKIRFRDDLAESFRIKYRGNDYYINSITEIEYRKTLLITCDKLQLT